MFFIYFYFCVYEWRWGKNKHYRKFGSWQLNLINSNQISISLQWRHNERDGVSNHRRHDCLLNRFVRRRSEKPSKLCGTDLCEGNSPVTGHKGSVTRKMLPYDDVIMFNFKKYDAFVSYGHHDSAWVRQELLPRLEEGNPPFRLCLHERDFLVGEMVSDNITFAINTSRRMILLLSNAFLQSHWCHTEFILGYQKVSDM